MVCKPRLTASRWRQPYEGVGIETEQNRPGGARKAHGGLTECPTFQAIVLHRTYKLRRAFGGAWLISTSILASGGTYMPRPRADNSYPPGKGCQVIDRYPRRSSTKAAGASRCCGTSSSCRERSESYCDPGGPAALPLRNRASIAPEHGPGQARRCATA